VLLDYEQRPGFLVQDLHEYAYVSFYVCTLYTMYASIYALYVCIHVCICVHIFMYASTYFCKNICLYVCMYDLEYSQDSFICHAEFGRYSD